MEYPQDDAKHALLFSQIFPKMPGITPQWKKKSWNPNHPNAILHKPCFTDWQSRSWRAFTGCWGRMRAVYVFLFILGERRFERERESVGVVIHLLSLPAKIGKDWIEVPSVSLSISMNLAEERSGKSQSWHLGWGPFFSPHLLALLQMEEE